MTSLLLAVIAGTLVGTTLAASDPSTPECTLGCEYEEVTSYTE
jgi:hypothetical protein